MGWWENKRFVGPIGDETLLFIRIWTFEFDEDTKGGMTGWSLLNISSNDSPWFLVANLTLFFIFVLFLTCIQGILTKSRFCESELEDKNYW